jgi:MFS transporter, PPP family, 3-phenylpropionic acid transporter
MGVGSTTAETRLPPAQPLPDPARLRVVKALYFFFFLSAGIFFSFINVYYYSIGLSGVQIGVINTLAPVIGIFGSSLWGFLSDRFGKTRLLLFVAALGSLIFSLGIAWVHTFAWILPLAAAYSLFNSTLIPLIDSTNFATLGEYRDRYSEQRIWGTIGFIITSSTIGILLERTGMQSMFVYYAITMGLLMVIILRLQPRPANLGSTIYKGLGQMVHQPLWVIFFASVFIHSIGSNGIGNFLGIALKDMGASDWLIGFCWTVTSLSELPINYYGARLIRRYGAPRLLALSYLVYFFRIILYGLMPNPNWVLAINLMHSASYALFWLGSVTYANDLAPDSLKATSQSLFLVAMNLAAVVGAPLAGWLYDSQGKTGMYLTQSLFSLTAFLVFVIGRQIVLRQGKKETAIISG